MTDRPFVPTLLLAASLALLAAEPAAAQSFRGIGSRVSPLPSPSELSPLDLDRAWWGQAPVSYGRDVIQELYVDEDNVYAVSRQGLVTAFDAETGQRLYATLLGSAAERAEGIATNSTMLLAPVGMELIAIDKFSGVEMFRLRLDGQPSTGPGVDDERVYVGTVDGSVYAYDLRRIRELFNDGRLPEFSHVARDWRFQGFGEITAPPVSTGRELNFATGRGVMYGLIASDRKLIYQFMTEGQIVAPVTRTEGRVLIPSTDLNVYSINDATGQLQWTFPTGTPVVVAPQYVAGRVYVVPERRGLHAVDVETGKLVWRQPSSGAVLSATPTSVYTSALGGRLLRLDHATGEITGELAMAKFTVRIGNERTDRLYLATPSGLLVCLKETGRDFPSYYRFPDRAPIVPELFDPERHATPDVAGEESDETGDAAAEDDIAP